MHQPHPSTPTHRVLALMLLLTGCAKPPPPPTSLDVPLSPEAQRAAAERGATTPIGAQPALAPPPAPRGRAADAQTLPPPSPPLADPSASATPGVVSLLWTIATPSTTRAPARLAQQFAQELPEQPIPASTRELWRTNGVALVVIPRARVRDLQAACIMAGPAQQQQFNFSHTRMELTRGETSGGADALTLDSGLINLRHETARLLLRAWPTPPRDEPDAASPPAPGLTLELTPELITANPTKGRGLPEDAAVTIAQASGTPLTRLACEIPFASADTALVIALAPPEIDDAHRATASSGLEPTGPLPPALPTLGDVLLADPFTFPAPSTQRLLIIVPTPPETFRLLR